MNDTTIFIFKTICEFIRDLNDVFGKNHKPLALYAHLIEKTGIIHQDPIKKHIQIFHEFCSSNEEAILEKNVEKIVQSEIRYSAKVFIDVKEILEKADADEVSVIWSHLLTIHAVIDPSSRAKLVLKEEMEKKRKSGESGTEEQFLAGLIDKVGKHVDPNAASPMDMMNQIMGSGVFQELVTNMNDGLSSGQLDMGKMIGGLQTMMGSLSKSIADTTPPQLS